MFGVLFEILDPVALFLHCIYAVRRPVHAHKEFEGIAARFALQAKGMPIGMILEDLDGAEGRASAERSLLIGGHASKSDQSSSPHLSQIKQIVPRAILYPTSRNVGYHNRISYYESIGFHQDLVEYSFPRSNGKFVANGKVCRNFRVVR